MAEEYNILLVEQDSSQVASIEGVLRQIDGFQVKMQHASEYTGASNILKQENSDLIVLDVAAENGKAMEMVRQLTAGAPTVPCIVLTASNDQVECCSGINSDRACDFLRKDQLTADGIARSIRYLASLSKLKMLEQTATKKVQNLNLLEAVTEASAVTGALPLILQGIVQAIKSGLKEVFVGIWAFEARANMLTLQACAGECSHLSKIQANVAPGTLDIGRIAQQRIPHLTNSPSADAWMSDPGWAAREGMVAFAGYPLIANEQLLGVIAISSKQPLSDFFLAGMTTVNKVVSITIERKIVERELLFQSQHAQKILELSADDITVIDRQGIITEANLAAEKLTGLSRSDFVGKHFTNVLSDPDQAVEAFKQTLEKGSIRDFIVHLRHASGNVLECSTNATTFNDQDGNLAGLIVTLRDITEHLQHKEELQHMAAIIASSSHAIVSKSLDGIVTSWNKAAETVYGYTEAEMIGQSVSVTIPHDRTDELPEILLKLEKGEAIDHFETQRLRKDGKVIDVSLAISPIKDTAGIVVGASTICRDISDRKELERKLLEERKNITAANQLLSSQTAELEHYAQQMELLIQLGEYLQLCVNDDEAHAIAAQFAANLFPETSGALYIFKESRNWLDRVSTWGSDWAESKGFPLGDCWSVRRGQPHSFSSSHPGPRCLHVPAAAQNCLCVPLVLLGEIFGVMCVSWNTDTVRREEDEKLVTRLTGDIALSLANLRLRHQLKDLSIRDPLTGLFNRRYMEEFFGQELSRARRKANQMSVMMIDIDHFKNFNDRYGHEAGDAVLHELGKFLKEQMRESDITCRYGGEEFIALLPEAPLLVAQRRAEDLRNEIKLVRVRLGDELLPPISISLGIASFPVHGQTMTEIIRAADCALYKAKEQGRDRVCVATDGGDEAKSLLLEPQPGQVT